jgi:predicted RNA-binding Zn-ribbon protein involved in translation (DUF1610 family)
MSEPSTCDHADANAHGITLPTAVQGITVPQGLHGPDIQRYDLLAGLEVEAVLGLCPTCGDLVASMRVTDPAHHFPDRRTRWQTLEEPSYRQHLVPGPCPRCGNGYVAELGSNRERDSNWYMCRRCGHEYHR